MKKIIIPISALLLNGIAHAQLTSGENYVYSKTYLDYNGTTPTKTAEAVQYFDGFGRPKQSVGIKASPADKDVVTHIVYDQYGRQLLDYLPVPQSGTQNGGIYPDPLANAPNTPYGTEKIYAEKQLENSPLDRILSQKQVGHAWDTKPVQFSYDANADGEVKKYIAVFDYTAFASSITLSPTDYGANQLYKNTVTDEDGNKTIEFKNAKGQVVLIRKMLNATDSADTYYVYNNYDQLAYVIPPLAVAANAVDGPTLDNLCYQYKYDDRNRLVEKKLPGKGWEYMVYDKQDRMVLTQDANLRTTTNNFSKKGWLFTKYDRFGRVAYTGFFANTATRTSMQTAINSMVANAGNNEEKSAAPFTLNGMDIYYTKNAFPTGSMTVLSVNYYDTYPAGTPAFTPTISGQSTILTDNMSSALRTKGLPLASYVKNIEDDNWTKSYSYYDTKGRVIGVHSINHLGGYTQSESKLDFAGVVQQTITRHKRLSTDTEKLIEENFTYDSQNRLLKHTHKVDNNQTEILTQNVYNELSQLTTKKVGGASLGTGLQEVNYAYNIRGWMTQINDPSNLGTDLFGYKINYNLVQGLPFPNADFSNLEVQPKYNGNIAEVSWKTLTEENEPLKRYGYVYDGLNRLQAGFYQKAGSENAQEYFEKLDYDLNGNISRLKRSADLTANSPTALLIDNLKYDYTGNRLTKVTEEQIGASNGYPYLATPNTITYDDNGNMNSHLDKGISSIQYNYLNLPKQITQNSVVTNYTYRADGAKLKKLFGDIETDYLDGFQYKSTKPSEGSAGGGGIVIVDPNEVAVMKLRIIPTAEGYFDVLNNQYIYNYTDHLGNVRLSYTDTNKDGVIQPRAYFWQQCEPPTLPWEAPMCISIWKPGEIVEINNYYPFGMLHNYTATTQNAYQYKYNGKELQETGMYDYGARMYMPDLGRWGVVDPLAEQYRRFSPYTYAVNNPIMFIDPDGRDIVPSKDFLASRYGSVYKSLRKSNSMYNSILSKYNNTKDNNYYLFLGENNVSVGANATTFRTASNRQISTLGGKVIKETIKGYEVETHYSKKMMSNSDNSERTEISLARTLIHEGVHAKLALNPKIVDDDEHNKYSEYQKNVLSALVEYNSDNKLGYSSEDLEAISWGGATDSKAFHNYINDRATKNGTTYDDEYNNWIIQVNNVEYKKDENEKK